MKRFGARGSGFTLIELLVVIAIITVLMAIAFPVFSRAREKARQTACMANLHNIMLAIRMYRMDEGHYPGPYDPVTGLGGLNDLYPTYLPDRRSLVCHDDRTTIETYGDEQAYPGGPKLSDLLNNTNIVDFLGWDNVMPSRERLTAATADQRKVMEDLFSQRYSSYNLVYNWLGYVPNPQPYGWLPRPENDQNSVLVDVTTSGLPTEDPWPLPTGTNLALIYMWRGWQLDAAGVDYVPEQLAQHLAQQIYWYAYADERNQDDPATRLKDSMGRGVWDVGSNDPTSYDYAPYGLPSALFPGLINRNAPENTIITRCVWHRNFWDTPHDIVLRLDGSAAFVPGPSYDWALQPKR
jgi:prepilin-type N-terminal cleavage/methylation domain-containing protein